MTATRRRRLRLARFVRPAALGITAAVVLAFGVATVQAQKAGSSYSERSSVFNPNSSAPTASKALGGGTLPRFEAPLVRERPGNHDKYFSDERPGQYKNKSLPAKRTVRGRRNNVSAKASARSFRGGSGMGMGGGGMSMPGMSRIQGMSPSAMMGMGRMHRSPAGTYGGARPAPPNPQGGK